MSRAFFRLLWRLLRGLGLAPLVERHVIPVFLDATTSLASNAEREARERCHRTLEALAASTRPILVGPWVSEVGFELLYWIPFLRWAFERYAIPRERVVAVSRGGADGWYGGLAGAYVDAYDCVSPAEFRQLNERRVKESGRQKHTSRSELDARLFASVEAKRGSGLDWLHPQTLYELFALYWSSRATIRLVDDHARYALLTPPPAAADGHAAVKFYSSQYFPSTDGNAAFVAKTVRRLAEKMPVLLLHTGLELDDHAEWRVLEAPQVKRLAGAADARTNLAVQTDAVARAALSVGTYGGFAYLAPFCGRPSLSFYSLEDQYLSVHLNAAQHACRSLRTAGAGAAAELIALNTRLAEAAIDRW